MKEGSRRITIRELFEDVTHLALNMEKGSTNKGMKVASSNWKREGNRKFP